MRDLGEFSPTITVLPQLRSTVHSLFSVVQGFQTPVAAPLLPPTLEMMMLGRPHRIDLEGTYGDSFTFCFSSCVIIPSAIFE